MRDLRNEGPEEVSEDGVEVVSRGDQTWGKMEERAKDVLDQK